jgi:hypothetical protein
MGFTTAPTLKPAPVAVSLSRTTSAVSATLWVKGSNTPVRRTRRTEEKRRSRPAPRDTLSFTRTATVGLRAKPLRLLSSAT